MRAQLKLPRVPDHHDPLAHFSAFHDALRDVLAWAPSVIDDAGGARAGDARFLRDFLLGPLADHIDDETTLFVPRLAHRRGAWLDGVLALATRGLERIQEAAVPVELMAGALARGEKLSTKSWQDAVNGLRDAVERALVFEEGVLLPTARLLLEDTDRAELRAALQAAEDCRPQSHLDWSEMAPLVPRRVHAVRTRTKGGLDVIRPMADCPKHRTVNVDRDCSGCAHLDEAHVVHGRGTVTCAIEATNGPARVADIMTRDVQCVSADVPAADLVRLLADKGIQGIPVVDDRGRATGIVSQSDIVRAMARGADLARLDVKALMNGIPFVVNEGAAVEDAARLIAFEGVHRLPVVNAEKVVVGVVSALDLVRWSIAKDGQPSA